MLDLGFWVLNDNVCASRTRCRTFAAAASPRHETMIWRARDEKARNYTFNYESAEGRQRGRAGALRLADPLCTGRNG